MPSSRPPKGDGTCATISGRRAPARGPRPKGISDQGYHYFDSAKMMCGIGKCFAEAMLGLQEREHS